VIYLDSNVWLYSLLAESDATKHQRANELIDSDICVATIQVINEVCRILSKKGKVSEQGIQTVIRGFYLDCTVRNLDEVVLLDASALRSEYNFSFWDSLHVASALKAGVPTLYSEDMQDGLIVRDKLKIENPFR
jgi:predicted nucleic acid-binding protein